MPKGKWTQKAIMYLTKFFHFFLKVSYLFSVTETYYNIVLHRSLVFNENPITYIQESSLVTSPRWHFVYLTDPLCIPPFIPGSLDSKCKPTVTFLPGSSVGYCQIFLSYIATAHTISPPPITKQALQAGKHCFKNQKKERKRSKLSIIMRARAHEKKKEKLRSLPSAC